MAERQKRELDAIYDSVEVRCVVSDLRGKMDGLDIPEVYVDLVTLPAYELQAFVKNPYFKRTLVYTEESGSGDLAGINDVRADNRLSAESGVSISYYDGYSEAAFAGNDLILWAHEEWLTERGLVLGDFIHLTVKESRLKFTYNPEGFAEEVFLIAGSYSGSESDTLYVPWVTANELADKAGNPIKWADSMSFAVADNREHILFKEVAAKSFAAVDISATYDSYYQFALTVHDNQFKQALIASQRSIQLFKTLMPLYYLASFAIGLLVCYIFTRNRRREFFLFRCIGLKPSAIVFAAVFEQMLLVIAGAALGIVLSMILRLYSGNSPAFGLLICSFLFGSVLSVLLNIRTGLLSYKEE
jgi:hypothetical protein